MLIVPEEPDGETLRVQVLKVFDGDGFLSRLTLPHRQDHVEVAVRMGFIDAQKWLNRAASKRAISSATSSRANG